MFIPPPRPDLVPRPHLIHKLNEGLSGKLTLISAPAGYGKSTLIVEWIRKRQLPVAWLSVDEGDNEPIGFFTYEDYRDKIQGGLDAALEEVVSLFSIKKQRETLVG